MIKGKAQATTHSLTPDSDETLVARLCEGEAEALDVLMARHASAVVAFCASYLDCDTAQDAAQETFVRVLVRCRTMRTTMRFKPWLYAIAHNVCVTMLRRHRLQASLAIEALAETARALDETAIDRDRRDAVLGEIDTLPTKYRDVMVLHYLSGLTCEETAAVMGLKTSAVKMRLRRAVLQIRDSLARKGMLP